MAQDSGVFGSLVLPGAAVIFIQSHIQHPMQIIFDSPVSANNMQNPLWKQQFQIWNETMRFWRDFQAIFHEGEEIVPRVKGHVASESPQVIEKGFASA